MTVKLLTEHHLEFLSLKEVAEAHPSLHFSKCQIVGNLMPRLIFYFIIMQFSTITPAVGAVVQPKMMFRSC